MNIYSHRGLWIEPAEKNTQVAFQRTIDAGFGTETDVRDLKGKLVISHDPPRGDELDFDSLIGIFEGRKLPLAVNVKADGLTSMLAGALVDRDLAWFAFDMSAPETLRYARAGLPFYTRHSDIEPEPILLSQAQGVWLDAFHSDWYGADIPERHLAAGKAVCVVSPDLHGREPRPLWERLANLRHAPKIALCTDQPLQAQEFFRS
jgi:glycerophosphoryl diester phosphodiesterase